jgi:hypothetical protein
VSYQNALEAFMTPLYAENRSTTPPDPQEAADAVAREVWPTDRIMTRLTLLCLIACMMTTFAGCGGAANSVPAQAATSTANAPASMSAKATQAAQPVVLTLGASSLGTIAQSNVRISAQVTVANHTAAAIHLGGSCIHPPVVLTVTNAATGFSYQTNEGLYCPGAEVFDWQPAVPAGGTHAWSVSLDLARAPNAVQTLRAGTYVVLAQVLFWHQGTLAELKVDQSLLFGRASSVPVSVAVT